MDLQQLQQRIRVFLIDNPKSTYTSSITKEFPDVSEGDLERALKLLEMQKHIKTTPPYRSNLPFSIEITPKGIEAIEAYNQPAQQPSQSYTYNISESSQFQVGNYNTMNIEAAKGNVAEVLQLLRDNGANDLAQEVEQVEPLKDRVKLLWSKILENSLDEVSLQKIIRLLVPVVMTLFVAG